MKDHQLNNDDIINLPAGRIINTLIMEYVCNENPERWSNSEQAFIPSNWFEELPRACAEDDRGNCLADQVPDFSGSMEQAMKLTKKLTDLNMKVVSETECWAAFSKIPFQAPNHYWRNSWVKAETMPLAIARAALMASRWA